MFPAIDIGREVGLNNLVIGIGIVSCYPGCVVRRVNVGILTEAFEGVVDWLV